MSDQTALIARLQEIVAEETAAEVLRKWTGAPILAVVPHDPLSSVEHGKLGQVVLDALIECDWANLAQ